MGRRRLGCSGGGKMKVVEEVVARVLLLVSVAASVGAQWSTTALAAVPPVYAGQELLRKISQRGELSSFYTSLVGSRIDLSLSEIVDRQPVTVFAPNNDAFNDLGPGLKDCLATEKGKINILTQIMTFHIAVGGNFTFGELRVIKQMPTVLGMPLDIAHINGKIVIESTGTIVNPSAIVSFNATVHIIDDVLIPENLVSNIWMGCGLGAPSSEAGPMPSAGAF